MIRLSIAVLALLAAACTPPPEEPAPPAEPPEIVEAGPPTTAEEATARDTCGAGAYQNVIGLQASDLNIQPSARVIAPGVAVTDDFAPDRLNFIVNAQGAVTEIRCY